MIGIHRHHRHHHRHHSPPPPSPPHRNEFIIVTLPQIIRNYIKTAYEILLFSIVITSCYYSVIGFTADMRRQTQSTTNISINKIAKCSSEYLNNRCASHNYPALEDKCEAWKQCMNQNTEPIRSKETIVLIADIANAFFARLDTKTLLWMSIAIVTFFTHFAI